MVYLQSQCFAQKYYNISGGLVSIEDFEGLRGRAVDLRREKSSCASLMSGDIRARAVAL